MTHDPIFKTDRLFARGWSEQDLDLAMKLWGDPQVTALIDSRPSLNRDQVAEKLQTELTRAREFGVQYWPLFENSSGDFVGCAGLRPWIYSEEADCFELGFHITQASWGKGLATEAAKGILTFGFDCLKLEKVYAGHNPNNFNSQKVLTKLGFVPQGQVLYQPTGLMHPIYVLHRPTSSSI
jgi:RimJ/RimL family protein N-acetyltransferase